MKTILASFIFIVCMYSCNTGPDPIKTGIDHCYFCKMTISDARFGAEIITRKGKIYKFDDSRCVLDFIKASDLPTGDVKEIYFSNFCEEHQLINVKDALFLQADNIRGPMGGNIAVFSQTDSLKKMQDHFKAVTVSWNEIKK